MNSAERIARAGKNKIEPSCPLIIGIPWGEWYFSASDEMYWKPNFLLKQSAKEQLEANEKGGYECNGPIADRIRLQEE